MASVWEMIKQEATSIAQREPVLTSFIYETITAHSKLSNALSYHLAMKLTSHTLPPLMLRETFDRAFQNSPEIIDAVEEDLKAVFERDPAIDAYVNIFLYYKGFHALQAYRISHYLWHSEHKAFALCLQSRISEIFAVDIHPAAKFGSGILVDHATAIVVGETAVVGDNVSMLHSVTLGGTGKECGDRHPKIGNGVLIGAGSNILGNIKIGDGAKIGAGSVVLENVPPHTTVAGVPAKIVGTPNCDNPSMEMNHSL